LLRPRCRETPTDDKLSGKSVYGYVVYVGIMEEKKGTDYCNIYYNNFSIINPKKNLQ
jgi:hypothetical protein